MPSVRMTASGTSSGPAPGRTFRTTNCGPPPSLSSSATVAYERTIAPAQRAQRGEFEQDLRRDDLGDDARELVGGAAAEDEVLPLGLGRQVSELPL